MHPMMSREATRSGMAGHADEARNPLMKELARVAVARGISQEELARRYAKLTNARVSSGNVVRHFESPRPRPATIRAYAQIMDVSDRHLRLVEGRGLTADQVAATRRDLALSLEGAAED